MIKKAFILLCVLATPAVAFGECTATTTYSSCNAGYGYNSIMQSCTVCRVGYYSSGGTTACTRCPSSGGVYGTTDSTGSTAITDCFIPADTDMTDTTGTYHFADDCYYTN